MKARSIALATVMAAIVTTLIQGNAFAQASVVPKNSTLRSFEKYTLRIPNERDVPTTRVEIRFPLSVRVVSFADVPGWTLELLTDSAKRVIGAAWTGSLPPQRFVELPFVAVNPVKPVKLVWPAFQTYASGERVDWVGHEDSKQPAPVTVVIGPDKTLQPALGVLIAALVLSITALILSLRSDGGSRSGFQPGA